MSREITSNEIAMLARTVMSSSERPQEGHVVALDNNGQNWIWQEEQAKLHQQRRALFGLVLRPALAATFSPTPPSLKARLLSGTSHHALAVALTQKRNAS